MSSHPGIGDLSTDELNNDQLMKFVSGAKPR